MNAYDSMYESNIHDLLDTKSSYHMTLSTPLRMAYICTQDCARIVIQCIQLMHKLQYHKKSEIQLLIQQFQLFEGRSTRVYDELNQ